ncbi:MAG TPA: RecX family transcriptional regulator [Candidatus Cloacimonadota bacterium]|nr:RecX family transcriptional regulator [Candidatus Cloacimonadota bacterium]HPS38445.1 RecX family transcriptional regulator [Candidatus Cloacimonadota bacterium]
MILLRTWTKPDTPNTAYISIDNKVWGTLPVRVLLPFYGVPVEQEIDEDEKDRLRGIILDHARDRLFDYLSKAEHSELSCRNLLKRKHLHPELIDACIADAKAKKFLSNERFAEIYVRSLLESGKSRRYIIGKLRVQQIPASIYAPILEEYYNRDESIERLTEEIVRMVVNYGDIPLAKKREKVFSSLYRRGWEMDTIHMAWERAGASEEGL